MLLTIAVVFGSGSSRGPWGALAVQVTALLIAAVLVARGKFDTRVVAADLPLWSVVGLIGVVPLVQLVPLPAAIWQALPGREVPAAAMALLGEPQAARPLSLYPARTVAAFLSLLPAVVMAGLVAGLSPRERRRILPALTLLALASAMLGAAQIAAGGTAFYIYDVTHHGSAAGFFANRNAHADFLLMGIVCGCAWLAVPRPGRGPGLSAMLGLIVLLLVAATITTQSRAGIGVLVILGVLGAVILVSRRAGRASLAVGLAAGWGALLLLSQNLVVQRSLARFEDLSDARPGVWRDTLFAIGQYWPAGSGMGTFVPAFKAAERLEIVQGPFVNRAHNDYLELLLEGGILSGIVFAAFAAFIVLRCVRLIRRPGELGRAVPTCTLFCWGVLAAHSLVDYPLRNQSLLVVAGLLLGLVAHPPARRRDGDAGSQPGVGTTGTNGGGADPADPREGVGAP